MKLSNLLQNPLNRKIDRAKVAEIKRAIKISGVIKPLVYTEVMTDKGKENMLTDGHHRYVALKEMGYKDAPVVMADERGIRTAQLQDVKPIHKGRKPCREGYYRDKDGKCRRRAGYGGGALIYHPHRDKEPENGNGAGNGSMGGGEIKALKKLITVLRNFVEKQARVAIPVVGNPALHSRLSKHPGHSDQGVHDPTRGKAKKPSESNKVAVSRYILGIRPALKIKGRIYEGVTRGQHRDIDAYDPDIIESNSQIGFVDAQGIWISQNEMQDFGIYGTSEELKDAQEDAEDYINVQEELRQRKVTKHLQGQHDQRTHSPKGRAAISEERGLARKPTTGREATRLGAIKGGAVHLATVAIPAAVTFAIIRGAPYLRFGVIGAGAALIIYETPQLVFRIIEGARRERKEFEQEREVKKVEAQVDKANRSIERGDHLLVLYNKQANVGVYLGNDKVRLINGPQFVDVKTSKTNRLKIASGQGVPSTKSSAVETTRRILRQVKHEQSLIGQLAQRVSTKVTKHGSHNQQDHDPTKGKGKAPDKGRLRLQLRPAIRFAGKVYAGERGDLHYNVFVEYESELSAGTGDMTEGFVDYEGNFLTRQEAQRRAGISTADELQENDKVAKHLLGQHDQDSHAPGTRSRGVSIPTQLKSFDGVRAHLSEGTKVMLSAERSNLSPTDNAARTARLRQDLGAISDDIVESDSRYGGVKERGFIASISPKQAEELSNTYNQDSHIIIRNGKAEMKFRDGSIMEGDVSEATERVGAEDNYSTVGGVKFTIPFKDRKKEQAKKLLKSLAELRDTISTLNRINKEGVTAADVAGLGLVREDLQDEMAHPHPGHVKKHLMGEHDQQSHAPTEGRGKPKSQEDALQRAKQTGKPVRRLISEGQREIALPDGRVIDLFNRGQKRGWRVSIQNDPSGFGGDTAETLAEANEMAQKIIDKTKARKGWTTPSGFRLSQKMDMDEGVDTKHPYKNPEGAQIEGGRVSF